MWIKSHEENKTTVEKYYIISGDYSGGLIKRKERKQNSPVKS